MLNALEYGEALFLLSEERQNTDSVLADLNLCISLLAENSEYYNLADTPAIPTEKRVALVSAAFQGIEQDLQNLIKILCKKRELYALPEIAKAYGQYVDKSRNIERVKCLTAVPLTDLQQEELCKKLSVKLGKNVIIENIIDKSVLGGVILQYSGKQYDGSFKGALEKIEKIVKTTVMS